ncbi:hypothetical protein HMPREF2132_08385 [Prevotella histicola JCM 15637 = DNF00424]|uniref:Uncharacterized protein n=1 Tax=Prevotella histicola JCM 15637 = DNF00424 TaxID=1236504 RepID=A0AAW3FF84_9BACT|nr:hypothetical protein HMPREF2132_08385 [Prevotella histicola JCM 15637 = DNF00424]
MSRGYKEACKRCPFALQNMPFYTSKDALLQCKRASFRRQKGVDGETKGKELYKKGGSKYGLPKPLQGEGMYLAGYRMMCVGDIEG